MSRYFSVRHYTIHFEDRSTIMNQRPAKKSRLAYFDNIRAVMIICVVLMHIAVTYSGFGGWYYKEKLELDALSTFSFALFQT